MGTDGDAADDDDALEGERYQGVRDLFRQARAEGFDEDPPARIDALLMAAARQHAPEPKAGAFERFRRWMVGTLKQPAVAGAVAVAVIGGAAGVLYMKGKGGVAEPTVSDTRGERAAIAEPAPPSPALEPVTGSIPAPGSGSVASAAESAELQARLREQMAQEASQRRATDRSVRPKGPGGGGGDDGAAAGGDEGGDQLGGERDLQLDYRAEDRDSTIIPTESGGGAGVVGGVKTTITAPDPSPPDGIATSDDATVATEELETPKNGGSAPETTGAGRSGTRPSNRTQAENLLRQARTAAKKQDCPTVRVMAKRAKQLDSTYYASTFSRDAAIKDCL